MAERCDWLARIGFGRAFVKHSVEYFVRLMNEVLRIQSLRVRFPVACHERNLGQGVRYLAAYCGVVHCFFQRVAMLVLIQADC